MRWHSTPESAKSGEPSILAIVETIAAILLSLWIAVRFDSIKYIAISACLPPLVLLRTTASIHYSKIWAPVAHKAGKKIIDKMEEITVPAAKIKLTWKNLLFAIIAINIGLVSYPLSIAVTGFGFFIVRILSLFLSAAKFPLETLKGIPTNWRRIVLCTDITHPPEVLADIETEDYGSDIQEIKFWNLIVDSVDKNENISFRLIASIFVGIPMILFWYIPAITYRWGLKSTAWIWSPLLWVVKSADEELLPRLKEIRDARWHKWMRWYSAVIALLFGAKFYLLWNWQALVAKVAEVGQIAEEWITFPGTDVLNAYIVPSEIPPWQIAAFTNSVLTWGTFFLADLLLVRHGTHKPLPPDEPLNKTFRVLAATRTFLSFYTMICVLYIMVQVAVRTRWNLPPLGGKLFPWQ